MLWFRKVVTRAAVGAAFFMLGLNSGHTQVGPNGTTTPSVEINRQLELLGKVLGIVRSNYVDKPDDQKLVTAAIDGIVKSLDPHSSYMDAKSYRDMQVSTSGQFGGLGMQVNMEDGLLKVVSPIDDTPAARAGILGGDIITQVDGEPTKDIPLDRVVAKMRGPVGSNVTLAIERQKEPTPIVVTLTREIIKVRPVSFRYEGGNVRYIRLKEFNN